jgi:hypothetical protein
MVIPLGFEYLIMVKITLVVFWVVMPYSLVVLDEHIVFSVEQSLSRSHSSETLVTTYKTT